MKVVSRRGLNPAEPCVILKWAGRRKVKAQCLSGSWRRSQGGGINSRVVRIRLAVKKIVDNGNRIHSLGQF